MTPPMTRPMGPIYLVVIVCLAVMIVMPLARRDDWLGVIAFIVIVAANLILWSLLVISIVRHVRGKRQDNDSDP